MAMVNTAYDYAPPLGLFVKEPFLELPNHHKDYQLKCKYTRTGELPCSVFCTTWFGTMHGRHFAVINLFLKKMIPFNSSIISDDKRCKGIALGKYLQ
jgi:hypothetical protein